MKLRSLLFLILVAFSTTAFAQSKFAYTNVEYVLAQMPESQNVQQQLQTYEQTLSRNLQNQYQTFEQSLAQYQQSASMMTDSARTARETQLQQMQADLQNAQVNAEQQLAQRQSELLAPLYERIQNAINQVAEEEGYTHVFRAQALLFAPETEEISLKVLAKLGITVEEAPATDLGVGEGDN
ncbi:OmpH family outer membrane protein [Balneola sp. MJW-20]|uniref:OmpH family outer membrane protein n=1 Tax=Gracilimonas aurantiaca TaxID=3234185 RepID=UPI0034667D09